MDSEEALADLIAGMEGELGDFEEDGESHSSGSGDDDDEEFVAPSREVVAQLEDDVTVDSLLRSEIKCADDWQTLLAQPVTLVVAQKLLWRLCDGSPSAFIRRLREAGILRKLVCGKVWGKGEWLYHCKNCEKDPQCAFCVSCFDVSLHAGHDFSMARANGGVCDCGDVNAWNPETFCSNHKVRPPTEQDRQAFAGHSFREGLSAIGRRLKESVQQLPSTRDTLVNLFRFFTALPQLFGDAVIPSVREVFFLSDNVMEVTCAADACFPEAFLQSLHHELIFAYIGNFDFKLSFSRIYARLYGTILDSPKKKTLQEFSVQVLTNSIVGETLLREEPSLFASLVCHLKAQTALGKSIEPLSGKQILDGDKVKFGRGALFRCVSDLRYLFTHKEAGVLVVESGEMWRNLIELCYSVQGSYWLKRKTGDHVAFEKQGYRDVIGWEVTLFETLCLLRQSMEVCSLPVLKQASMIIWEKLAQWLHENQATPGVFSDEHTPLTLGLTLHRMLSLVLRSACLGKNRFALQDVAPFLYHSPEANLQIMAHLAREFRFCAAVEGGLWRRNGETAVIMQWFYMSPMCFEYRENDYFLMRCCLQACAFDASFFFDAFLWNFSCDPRHVYAEAALRLLLTVTSDRAALEDDEATVGRRVICHVLAGAKGSAAHSQLVSLVPDVVARSLRFEEWVKDVADFSASTLSLKKSCLALVDPFYSSLLPADQRQAAEEFLADQWRKATKSPSDAAFSVGPARVSPPGVRFGGEGVAALLSCPKLWTVCFGLLEQAQDKQMSVCVLRAADMLTVCAQPGNPQFLARTDLPGIVAKLIESASPYVRTALLRLQAALNAHGQQQGLAAATSQQPQESEADRKARMREEAKARQAAIQKKMQESRNKFAEANASALKAPAAEVGNANVETAQHSDDADQCVLCRDATSVADNPLCSLVLLQRFAVVEECSVDIGAQEADAKRQKVLVTRPDLSSLLPQEADTYEVALRKSQQRLLAKVLDIGPPELSLRSCNHTLHMNCYQQHFSQFYSRNRLEIRDEGINLDNGEYFCPLCHSLCNAVIPIVKSEPVVMPPLSPQELLRAAAEFYKGAPKENAHLSLAALRAGMLVWGHPPPIPTVPLLFDAPIAACLADELTRDEGTRDPMMRQTWLGCTVLANACDQGDVLTTKELFGSLTGSSAARLDPLLTFGRLLLALPARLRVCSVAALFSLCGVLCLKKEQDFGVFSSRCESLIGAVGLSVKLPPRDQLELCHELVQVDRSTSTDSIFCRRLSLQLASLPLCLQDKTWFNQSISWKCPVCGTTPTNVAICLLCGERVCKNGNCCRKNGDGECAQHSSAKHSSVGLYFDIQDNTVLIVRGEGGGCITKSPYIDAWGEEDVGLRRGKPVFLHMPILEELRRRFICGGLVDKTVSTGMRLLLPSWKSF